MLNKSTRHGILTTAKADCIPLEQINRSLAVLEGKQANATGFKPLLVNQATAARLLSVSRFTIRKLVTAGHLQPVTLFSAVRYRLADLERVAGPV